MRGAERSISADGIALEARGLVVEIDVAAMLQAEVGTAGKHEREVRIAMAVAITHAAAK